MSAAGIPATVADIDAAWLTAALRRDGGPSPVALSVGAEVIGVGSGFAGSLARLTVDYPPGPTGPRTLIAKSAAQDPGARAFFLASGIYATEVGFYTDMAPSVPVRVPACHYAALDSTSGEFVLLLEDLAPARVGDQVASCTQAEAELAVTEIARLHAAFWAAPALAGRDWLKATSDPSRIDFLASAYAFFQPAALRNIGGLASPRLQDVASRLGPHLRRVFVMASRPPVTLVHGDYRLDNMLFGPHGDAPLALIDWQAASRARGPVDLAYFLNGSLGVEDRRRWREGLMVLYLDTLAIAGVRGYSAADCRRDMDVATLMQLAVFLMLLSASPLEGDDRQARLGRVMVERTNAALDDIDLASLDI